MNPITLTGTAGSDATLRFSSAGTAVASFSVATSERKKDAAGNWLDGDTTWWKVVCFNAQAENVAVSVLKGTRVVVTGKATMRTWGKDDGTKGYSLEVVADEVAASMRWAEVTVAKNERSSKAYGSASPDEYATPAGTKPVANTPDSYDYDAEPF